MCSDLTTSSNEHILQEINTKFAAPMILTRLLLPHLVAKSKERPANILFSSSGLAYIPLGMCPAYCPAEAGIHSLCVVLRQQLATVGTKVSGMLSSLQFCSSGLPCCTIQKHADCGLHAGVGDRDCTSVCRRRTRRKLPTTNEGEYGREGPRPHAIAGIHGHHPGNSDQGRRL